MQVEIVDTPVPAEANNYLRSRGWWTTQISNGQTMWSSTVHGVDEYTWNEALSYEMFMHLYYMKGTTDQTHQGDPA